MTHVADNANDHAPGTFRASNLNELARGIGAGPDPRCEKFVDENDRRRAGMILRIDGTTAAQWDSHRLDVARRHSIAEGARRVRRIVNRLVLKAHAIHIEIAAQGELARAPDGFHAWKRTEPFGHLLESREDARIAIRPSELWAEERKPHRQDILRQHPGRNLEYAGHAPERQTSARQQHHSQGDIHYH